MKANPYNKSSATIAGMFNDIAPRYDFLNHLFSLGIDKCWRKKLLHELIKHHPHDILDVATGTGDLAILLHRKTPATVTGIDISEGMLEVAKEKAKKLDYGRSETRSKDNLKPEITFQLASAEALPFSDISFDAVTVAFGVRNFEHLHKGLCEMQRVLRPGGMLAVLEFTTPRHFPVKQGYHLYFHTVIPFVGRLFSKHRSAYSYLPASVSHFPQRDTFLHALQQAGFSDTRYHKLSCGIAAIYIGTKGIINLTEV